MQDHTPITTTQFMGLYDRSTPEDVPFKYFTNCLNMRFEDGLFKTREGSAVEFGIADIKRMKQCLLEGQAPVELALTANGQLYDLTDSPLTPILTIPAMTDFSATVMNNRVYITPHNGLRGLPGEKVYVYDGASVRAAGGEKPPSPPAVATGGPGNVELGIHCFTVVFESASGFISGFPAGIIYNATGNNALNFSNVPIGPTGTVARHILGTRTIIAFNGDSLNQQYFFLPGGTIQNNVDIVLNNVNYYDSQLVEEATYLQDALAIIPAGVHISSYLGSLVTCGEDANPDIVRISFPGEPENFDSVEGFIRFGPDGAGTVENTFELRGQLFVCKRSRTYVTQTNGENAIFWNFTDIDLSKGTSCHGVGLVESTDGSNTQDLAFVADRQALYAFTGTYSEKMELTWPILKWWKRINKKYFHTIEVIVDTLNEAVYVAVPLDAAQSPSHVLYGDYSGGISPESIKWCPWVFPVPPTSIGITIDAGTEKAHFRYASTNINKLNESLRNDNGLAIHNYARFAYTSTGYPMQVNHYCGVAIFADGVGMLDIMGFTMNDARSFTFPNYSLNAAPEFYLTRGFSVNTEKMSVQISLHAPNAWMMISSYTIFCKPVATSRPNYA